jgi:hypothetical protein
VELSGIILALLANTRLGRKRYSRHKRSSLSRRTEKGLKYGNVEGKERMKE